MASMRVSKERISSFLLSEELDYDAVGHLNTNNQVAVKISNADFGWDRKTVTLSNINVEIKKGKLVAIIGKVGSCKTSLLLALLGEMNLLNDGSINMDGSVAYVSQLGIQFGDSDE